MLPDWLQELAPVSLVRRQVPPETGAEIPALASIAGTTGQHACSPSLTPGSGTNLGLTTAITYSLEHTYTWDRGYEYTERELRRGLVRKCKMIGQAMVTKHRDQTDKRIDRPHSMCDQTF